MVRQITRQFCRTTLENDHKPTTRTKIGIKQSLSHPVHFSGLPNLVLLACLLLGSLYLPAQAEPANKAPTAKPAQHAKKSPETLFMEGDNCLKQADIACAKLALANIPGTSPYAKLLQGSIALIEMQTNEALLLLLPLQAEKKLTPQAKIALHEYLASAFESIEDKQQAIQHLIHAELTMTTSLISDAASASINTFHQKIWGILSKSDPTELIEWRGNNTDNIFQGWVDLRIAANTQNPNNSIEAWNGIYPDHLAQTFAKNLSSTNAVQANVPAKLKSDGGIALMMPLTIDTTSAKANAFRLGLETALTKRKLKNPVKIYPATGQDADDIYALAKNEGNAYFIAPDFDTETASNSIEQTGSITIIHTGMTLTDEAQRIIDFTIQHAMQNLIIITTENDASSQILASFQQAWKARADNPDELGAPTIITLPGDLALRGSSLLELKSQISAQMHDIVVLAMPEADIRIVKPYLDISTPTITFSSVNEIRDHASYAALNALRFVDIPFLVAKKSDAFKAYASAAASLNSNELSRWFALGADSLQLLLLEQPQNKAISINGLTGTLTLDNAGNLTRTLSLGRFTYDEVVAE